MKYTMEKHRSSSMLLRTMTIEISTNLKGSNNGCFRTTLEDKLNHNLMIGLQVQGGSKACSLSTYIVNLKREAPMSTFYALN
jgi:hypothetical protein